MQPQQSWMMTLLIVLIAFFGGYLAAWHRPSSGRGAAAAPPDRSAAAFFSPGGGCTASVVSEIASARHSLELQGYSLTSPKIGDALIGASRRGVDVRLLLDAAATGDNRREAKRAWAAGATVLLDSKHGLAHNKIVLIDHRTLITGSFDFTPEAEDQNAENVLILRDQPRLQAAYEENFHQHWIHGEPFDGR